MFRDPTRTKITPVMRHLSTPETTQQILLYNTVTTRGVNELCFCHYVCFHYASDSNHLKKFKYRLLACVLRFKSVSADHARNLI